MTTTVQAYLDRAFNAIENSSVHDGIKSAAIRVQAEVKCLWNTRIRRCAGYARLRKMEIHLNREMFFRVDEREQYDTVSHELAHLIDYKVRLTSKHDYLWRNIHRTMGGSGSRCFSGIAIKRNAVKRYHILDNRDNKTYTVKSRFYNKHIVPLLNTRFKLLEVKVLERDREFQKISA